MGHQQVSPPNPYKASVGQYGPSYKWMENAQRFSAHMPPKEQVEVLKVVSDHETGKSTQRHTTGRALFSRAIPRGVPKGPLVIGGGGLGTYAIYQWLTGDSPEESEGAQFSYPQKAGLAVNAFSLDSKEYREYVMTQYDDLQKQLQRNSKNAKK